MFRDDRSPVVNPLAVKRPEVKLVLIKQRPLERWSTLVVCPPQQIQLGMYLKSQNLMSYPQLSRDGNKL